eukprot:8958631-Alexandrium_andersonii.AAC.1
MSATTWEHSTFKSRLEQMQGSARPPPPPPPTNPPKRLQPTKGPLQTVSGRVRQSQHAADGLAPPEH